MSQFNPRRAFRDERMRRLYLAATKEGWTHRLDGAGHLAMTSPDGKAHMSLSMTSGAARTVLNTEAIFKRWLKFHDAITVTSGLPPVERYIGDESYQQPKLEIEEAPVMGDAADLIKDEGIELPDETLIVDGEMAADEEANPPMLCADGCGKPVKTPGGYARGHNPNSGGYHARGENGATIARPREPSLFKVSDDRFSIGEVIDIANFAGDSGLVEVSKLQKGLTLMLKLRGNR